MLTSQTMQGYVKAEPFRPFLIRMASGRAYEIRHPEMIKVLKTYALIFKNSGDDAEFPDEFESISLMLAESIAHLETPVR